MFVILWIAKDFSVNCNCDLQDGSGGGTDTAILIHVVSFLLHLSSRAKELGYIHAGVIGDFYDGGDGDDALFITFIRVHIKNIFF